MEPNLPLRRDVPSGPPGIFHAHGRTGRFGSFGGRILSRHESRSFVGRLVDKCGMGKTRRLVAFPGSWREGGSEDGPSKQAEFADWMRRRKGE